MKKSIIIGLIFLIFLAVPYLIDFFVIGNENVKINVKNSDFFLFLGSYLGASFGALITILGLSLIHIYFGNSFSPSFVVKKFNWIPSKLIFISLLSRAIL